ncbi:MAG: hypothetical protein WC480_02555 [Patescibacteria group bacterium]
MSNSDLEKSVLQTLAFFAIFGYPLTAMEVWRYLYSSQWPVASGQQSAVSLGEVMAVLDNSSRIKTQQGFYFLDSAEAVTERQERYKIAEVKFKLVKKVAKLLACLPFVRLIAVCNTLAYSNASLASDIDLFIVAAKGKVWTTRFFTLLILKILGRRPAPGKSQNAFCLSFWVDENYLNLESLALAPEDIYLTYWLEQLYPVYDRGGYYQKLRQNNLWLKKYLGNSLGVEPNLERVVRLGWFGRFFKQLSEWKFSFNFWETGLKNWQLKHLPQNLKNLMVQNEGVVIRQGVIKLIANDRRRGYYQNWQERVRGIEG